MSNAKRRHRRRRSETLARRNGEVYWVRWMLWRYCGGERPLTLARKESEKRQKHQAQLSPGQDGTPVLSADQLTQIELRAINTVLRESDLISGAELRFARKALGLKQTELADHLGVKAETISRWENEAEAFKRAVQLKVMALVELRLNMGA
jgi:DNA-binding transcriptional regulator YiaG